MSKRFDEFELLVSSSGTRVQLSVSGHIDLASVPALRAALEGVVDAGTGDVDVDLSDTGFCDSVGLHALLAAQDELDAAGRTMRLINPPACVIRLLHLTATSDVFQVVTQPRTAGDLDAD